MADGDRTPLTVGYVAGGRGPDRVDPDSFVVDRGNAPALDVADREGRPIAVSHCSPLVTRFYE